MPDLAEVLLRVAVGMNHHDFRIARKRWRRRMQVWFPKQAPETELRFRREPRLTAEKKYLMAQESFMNFPPQRGREGLRQIRPEDLRADGRR